MDKEAKLKEKKKIIIEALKRCLERSVYSNITVQEVADEAGFSKGGLLHYFQSKEDMYMELIRDVFEEIHEDHARVLNGNLDAREQAGISALYGVEKFFLDKRTTKIFLNLMLYAFEDENIMNKMKEFFHKHLEFYTTMIDRSHAENPQRRKTDIDPVVAARIAQIVMIGAGMFESVDQTNIDQYNLTRYVLSLIKG
ncbi:MAG TPA: TetR/AcrR family transcriptional regulator [Spirochaetota bacterium]|nr:TetR/AcrR family transcriptional regulator [Spirochaetota bacterium]